MNDRDFKYFTTNKVRTEGSMKKSFQHIYMKPWRYVESDVNIKDNKIIQNKNNYREYL